MGMSTHVIGFRPPDEKWKKMKAVWDACNAAGTNLPKEVDDFFEGEEPDPRGVEVDIKAAVGEYSDRHGNQHGFEINIRKLPKDVSVIRFYNSW